MGKLRLSIKSTDVLGVYGIVDLVFNGDSIESNRQLTADTIALEYDVDILTDEVNSLKVSLLNDQAAGAKDSNAEGQFMMAKVNSLSYSIDNSTYITLLPQQATSYTVPIGPFAGEILVITENISEWVSFGKDYAITFNSDGIVDSQYISGLKGKVLPNGYWHDLTNGFTDNFDKQHVVFENGEWILLE